MRILIAVDETPESIDAVRTAHQLFGDDATYTVATIGEPSRHLTGLDPIGAMTYDVSVIPPPEPRDPEAVARAAAQQAGVSADVIAEIGDPGPRLCNLAAELDADVLVVGNHERGFLSRLLDPSVQHHVTNHAPCPVLIVRGP